MKVFIALYLLFFVDLLWEGHCLEQHVLTSPHGMTVTLVGHSGELVLDINAGTPIVQTNCTHPSSTQNCFQNLATNKTSTVKKLDTGNKFRCSQFIHVNPDSKQTDCFDLGDALWYGGSEMKIQRFPIKDMNLKRVPYVTGDFGHNPLGGIMDSLWLNSQGYSVFVDRQSPLFLSFNNSGDGKMCFSASYDEFPFAGASQTRKADKELRYTVCSSDNIRNTIKYVLREGWLDKPSGVIDPSVVAYPIWSTWAQFKAAINATTVLNFAKKIAANGFRASHFEIDDNWETCYGELEFNLEKFPDPAEMVRQIKSLGFNVSIWIHPYTNVNCPSFKNPQTSQFFLRNATSGDPLKCVWWNGVGGYLDTTNPEATDHFVTKVTNLRESYGIDSFKFDSGEVGYFQPTFQFADKDLMATPNDFTRLYVETASRLGNGVEVRVAYNSQKLPIFVRMLDKDSNWDYNNGLQTLIPTALHMSVIGYPFILPDMIGGNNYGSSALPDRELFIRWLQVNVFMPVLQFSIAPWDYDQEVVTISLAMVTLHEQYASVISQLAQEAVETGNPIVRPLWWIAPTDSDALRAEQQFLLGNDLLVAPVVEKGAVSRDIYLPKGIWVDQIDPHTFHMGPIWLRNYPANLSQLPYFNREV